MILHEFFMGRAFDAHTYFGAHPGPAGVFFRVFAPNAKKVTLIGEFNDWQEDAMSRDESGVFTGFSADAKPGQMYKYKVYQMDGNVIDKTDPYAFSMELRPDSASIIVDQKAFAFEDEAWLKKRDKNYDKPMNIYEVHAGSFKKPGDKPDDWYTYRELAELLIPYAKENHYTHIEFLPLSEYPFDGSWGYQVTGFFAPTSRYGSPDDLKYLVNECHKAGLGVIVDYVPVHFAKDYYGLIRFDGSALYEYPSNDVGYSEWGSCNFNYYRGEVRSFLQSAANYWIEEFHMDGIRMDAISNVIYWMGNEARGVNPGGIDFIRRLNEGLHSLHPDVMTIAEDSSSYLKVTAPVKYEGLGFDYKWDMGWMNDTLRFFAMAPEERVEHYHDLSFSMYYFPNELYLMTFSHDEVVHGKKSIVEKMWGSYEERFAQAKTLYTYMFTHPGKKLNFMGNEIGHIREWDEEKEIDWFLLDYPVHDAFHKFIMELNGLYSKSKALYEKEYDPAGFEWMQIDAAKELIYVYERSNGPKSLVIAMNLSDKDCNNYSFSVDEKVMLSPLLMTDDEKFGGKTNFTSVPNLIRSQSKNLTISLPAFSAIIFEAHFPDRGKNGKKKNKKKKHK